MRKAFEWFEARLKQRMRGDADPGMALAQLVETLSDKLFFTVITVADELNAYKVFEMLNARGVRPSATELLKNDLFSVLARDPHSQATTDALDQPQHLCPPARSVQGAVAAHHQQWRGACPAARHR